jgi:hypothetical protein
MIKKNHLESTSIYNGIRQLYQTIIAEKLEGKNQCCGSGPDPNFYLSRIQDPKTATKEDGKIFVGLRYLYYVATNMKNLSQFTKIIVPYFRHEKLSLSCHKYGFEIRDQSSGKNPYSGSRNQG